MWKEILGFPPPALAPCSSLHSGVQSRSPHTWRGELSEPLLGPWGLVGYFCMGALKCQPSVCVSWWRYLCMEEASFSLVQRSFASANYGNPWELAIFLEINPLKVLLKLAVVLEDAVNSAWGECCPNTLPTLILQQASSGVGGAAVQWHRLGNTPLLDCRCVN